MQVNVKLPAAPSCFSGFSVGLRRLTVHVVKGFLRFSDILSTVCIAQIETLRFVPSDVISHGRWPDAHTHTAGSIIHIYTLVSISTALFRFV